MSEITCRTCASHTEAKTARSANSDEIRPVNTSCKNFKIWLLLFIKITGITSSQNFGHVMQNEGVNVICLECDIYVTVGLRGLRFNLEDLIFQA